MTQRTPTIWDTNTAKNDGVPYSSASVTYSSATTSYSSATVGVDEYGKTAGTWTPVAKTATGWIANPAYDDNQRAYDSAVLYDTTATYDGVVVGADSTNTKQPTVWSNL